MKIKALKGLRYNGAAAGDTSICIAPPYDVIDSDMQQSLYQRSPYNIVRIIKGKTFAGDNDSENQYSRAAAFLNEWVQKGVLAAEPVGSMYAYIQDFEIGGRGYQRTGFIALGELAKFGRGVCPHEKTLEGPKADRLRLTYAIEAQAELIFMLYDDPQRSAEEVIAAILTEKTAANGAVIDFRDNDGARHRLFVIDRTEDIERLKKTMAPKHTIIADGHHRYETALNYYAQIKKPSARYALMAFVNMSNPGLVILPTHRVVRNISGFDAAGLIERIRTDFEVERIAFSGPQQKQASQQKMFSLMKQRFENHHCALGLYTADGSFYLLGFRDNGAMERLGGGEQLSPAARKLDVNILHKLILEEIMGIGEKALASEANIEYIKDIGDAIGSSIGKVDGGRAQAVFFMNPTRIEQVRAMASAGQKMPQKSTFFYPKVFSGLVINKL